MDKNDIIDYVMHTPHNTNKAVLSGMLNQLTEGGGGSSDFSTAKVTVTGIPNEGSGGSAIFGIVIPMVHVYYDANLGKGMIASMAANGTVTAVLYQGYQYIFVDSVSDWTVTGSATIDEALGCIIITGDCTITYSSGSDDSGSDDSTVN